MQLCDYGCGNKAKFTFKNGRLCCSSHYLKCPINKKIGNKNVMYGKTHSKKSKDKMRSMIGKHHTNETKLKISNGNKGKIISDETKLKIGNFNRGKIISDETKLKMSLSHKGKRKGIKFSKKHRYNLKVSHVGKKLSKSHINNLKLSIEQIKLKYLIFSKVEEIRYKLEFENERIIQVHCKNHNCPNSKEKGGWFTPTRNQLYERIRQVEHPEGNGGNYFYCCEQCKQECPLFRLYPVSIINQNNLSNEIYYTYSEHQTWRQEVLKRAKFKCEYCSKKATDVHHSRPQKLEPFYSLDPDYGIACCESCHYKYGHKDECSTGQLATKVC